MNINYARFEGLDPLRDSDLQMHGDGLGALRINGNELMKLLDGPPSGSVGRDAVLLLSHTRLLAGRRLSLLTRIEDNKTRMLSIAAASAVSSRALIESQKAQFQGVVLAKYRESDTSKPALDNEPSPFRENSARPSSVLRHRSKSSMTKANTAAQKPSSAIVGPRGLSEELAATAAATAKSFQSQHQRLTEVLRRDMREAVLECQSLFDQFTAADAELAETRARLMVLYDRLHIETAARIESEEQAREEAEVAMLAAHVTSGAVIGAAGHSSPPSSPRLRNSDVNTDASVAVSAIENNDNSTNTDVTKQAASKGTNNKNRQVRNFCRSTRFLHWGPEEQRAGVSASDDIAFLGDPEGEGGGGKKTKKDEASAPRAFPANMSSYHIAQLLIRGVVLSKRTSNEIERLTKLLAQPQQQQQQQQQHEQLSPNSSSSAPASNRNEEVLGAQLRGLQLEFHNQTLKLTQQFSAPEAQRIVFLAIIIQKNIRRRNAMRQFGALSSWRAHVDEHRRVEAFKAWRRRLAAEILARHQKLRLVWRVLQKNAGDAILRRARFLTLLHSARGRATMRRSFLMWHRFSVYVNSPVDEYTHLRLVRKFEGDEPGDNNEQQPTTDCVPEGILQQSAMGSSAHQAPKSPAELKHSQRAGSVFGGAPVSPSLARRLSRNETLRVQFGVRPKRSSASGSGDSTPITQPVLSAGNSPSSLPRVTLLLGDSVKATTSSAAVRAIDFGGSNHLSGGGSIMSKSSFQIAQKIDSLELSIEGDEDEAIPKSKAPISPQQLHTSVLLGTSTGSSMPFGSAPPPPPRNIPSIEEIYARRFRLHAWDKFLAEDVRRVKLMRSGVLCGTDPLLNQAYYLNRWRKYVDSCRQKRRKVAMAQRHYELTVVGKHFFGWLNLRCFGAQQKAKNKAVKCLAFTVWKRYVYREKRDHERCQALKGMRALKLLQLWRYRTIHYRRHLAAANLALTLNRARLLFPMLCMLSAGDPVYELQGLRGPSAHSLTVAREHDVSATSTSLGPLIVTDGSSSKAQRKTALQNILGQPSVGEAPSAAGEEPSNFDISLVQSALESRRKGNDGIKRQTDALTAEEIGDYQRLQQREPRPIPTAEESQRYQSYVTERVFIGCWHQWKDYTNRRVNYKMFVASRWSRRMRRLKAGSLAAWRYFVTLSKLERKGRNTSDTIPPTADSKKMLAMFAPESPGPLLQELSVLRSKRKRSQLVLRFAMLQKREDSVGGFVMSEEEMILATGGPSAFDNAATPASRTGGRNNIGAMAGSNVRGNAGPTPAKLLAFNPIQLFSEIVGPVGNTTDLIHDVADAKATFNNWMRVIAGTREGNDMIKAKATGHHMYELPQSASNTNDHLMMRGFLQMLVLNLRRENHRRKDADAHWAHQNGLTSLSSQPQAQVSPQLGPQQPQLNQRGLSTSGGADSGDSRRVSGQTTSKTLTSLNLCAQSAEHKRRLSGLSGGVGTNNGEGALSAQGRSNYAATATVVSGQPGHRSPTNGGTEINEANAREEALDQKIRQNMLLVMCVGYPLYRSLSNEVTIGKIEQFGSEESKTYVVRDVRRHRRDNKILRKFLTRLHAHKFANASAFFTAIPLTHSIDMSPFSMLIDRYNGIVAAAAEAAAKAAKKGSKRLAASPNTSTSGKKAAFVKPSKYKIPLPQVHRKRQLPYLLRLHLEGIVSSHRSQASIQNRKCLHIKGQLGITWLRLVEATLHQAAARNMPMTGVDGGWLFHYTTTTTATGVGRAIGADNGSMPLGITGRGASMTPGMSFDAAAGSYNGSPSISGALYADARSRLGTGIGGSISPASGSIFGGVAIPTPMSAVMGGGVGLSSVAGVGMLTAQQRELMDSADAHRNKLLTLLRATEDLSANDAALRKKVRTVGMAIIQRIWDLHGGIGRAPATYSYSATAAPAKVAIDASRRGSEVSDIGGGRRASYVIGGAMENYGRQGILSSKQPATPAEPTAIAIDHRSNVAGAPLPFALGGTAMPPSPAASALSAPERRLSLLGAATAPTQSATAANSSLKKGTMGQLVTHGNAFYGPYPADFFDVLDLVGFNPYYLRRGAATSKTNQLNQSRKTYKLQRMLALVLQLEKIRESEPFVVVVEHPVERSSTSNLFKAAAAELGIDEIKEYEVQMPWGGIVRGAYGGQTTGAALKRARSGFANSSFSFLADKDEHEDSVASSSVTSSFRVSRTTSSSKKHKDGRLSRSASNVASANDIRKAKISPSMPYQLATLIAANPKKFDVEVRNRRRRWSAHSLPEMLARHERIARRHGGVSQDGGSAFQSGSMAELFSLGDNDSSCLWQTVYDRPLRKIVATEIVSKASQSSPGGPLTSPLTTPPTSPQADKAISIASSTPLRSTGLLSPDQAEMYSLMDADTDPFAPLEARVAHRLRRIAIGAGITNAMSEMVQSLTKEAEERLHDKATMASRTNGASAAPPFGSSSSTQKGGALFSTTESKADSDDERRLDDMDPVEKRRLQAELMFELQSQSRAGARGTGGFVGKQKPTTISQALKATAAIAHKHNQSGGNTTSAISAARKANAGQSAGKPLYGAQRGGAREGNLGAQSIARALSQRPYSNRLKGDEKVSYDIITGAISGSREALIGILKHRVETYRAFFSRSGRARSCPAHIAVPVPDPAEDMYDTDYLSSRMGALRRGGGAKKPYVDAVDSAEANRQKILNEMMATQKNLLADKGGNGTTKHFLLDADDDEEAKRKRRNPLRLDDTAKTLLMSDFSFGDQYVETPRSDFEGSGRKRGAGEPKTVGTTLTTNADKLRMMMGSTSEANKDADKSASVSTDDIDQPKRKGREESIEATRLRELKDLAERMLKESGNVVQMQIDMEKVFEEQRLAAEAEERQRLRKEEEAKMLLLSPHLGNASSTTRPPTADISGGMTKRGSFSNQQQPLTHTGDNSNNSSMNRKPSVKELRDVMLASALETSRRTSSMRDLANSPLSPKTTLRGAADSNNAPSSTAQIRNTSFSGFGNFVDNNSIAIEKDFGGATQPDGSIVPVVAKGHHIRRQSSASPTQGNGSDDDYEEGDEDEDEDMGGELTVSNTLLEAELAKMVVREESKRNLADDGEDDEEIDDTATTAGSSEGSQARKGRGGSLASRSSAVKPTNSMGKSGRVSRVASTTGKISRTSSTSSRAVVATRSTIGKGFNKSTRPDTKVVVYPTGLAGRIPSTSATPNQSDLPLYRSSKTNIGGARTMQQPLFSGEVPTDQPTPTTTISLNEQTGSLTLVGPVSSSADAILLPSLQRVSAVGTPARIWADLDEGKVTAKATERLLEITTRRGTALDAANKLEIMLLKSQLEELLGHMRDIETSEEGTMAARATNLEESVERNPFQEDPNAELEPRPLSHSDGAQHIEKSLKLPEMAGKQSGGLADTSATSPLSASLSLTQLRSREDVLLQQRHPQRTLKAGSPVRIAGQNTHRHPRTTSVEGLAQPVFFSANQLIIDRQQEEEADRRRREAESAMGIRSATPHTLTTRSHLKPNSAPGSPFQVSTDAKVAAQVADRRKKWAKAMKNMSSCLTTSAQPPCTTSEEVGYNYHRRASRYPDQENSGARCATPPKARQLTPRSRDAAKHGTGSVGDPTAALHTDDELKQRVAKAASILALLPDYLRSELEEMAAEEQEQKRLRKLISSGGSATPTSHKKSLKKGPPHAERLFPHIPTSEISVVNTDRPHSRAATTPVKPQSHKSKASHTYSLKVATPQPALETTPLGEDRFEPLSTGYEPLVSYDTDIDPNAGRLLESVAMHKQALKEQLGYVDDDEEDEDIAAATSSAIGKSAVKKATARKELSITDFRSASDLSKAASIAELMQHTADMFASSQGHLSLGGRVAMSAPPKVHSQKGSSTIVLPSTATSRTPEPQGLRPPTQSATESTKSEMHANELNIEDYRTQDELVSDSVLPQLVGLGTEEGIGKQSGRLLLFQPPTSTMPRPQSQQQRGTQRRPATDTPEAFFAPSSQKGRAASSAAKERPPLWQHRSSDAPPYGTVSVSSTSVTLGMPSLGTSQFLNQPKDATAQLPPRASSAFSGTRHVALNAGGGRLGSKLRQHQQNATAASLVSASFKNNMSYLDELTDSEMATLVDAETDFQHWRVAAERKIHLKATHADGIEEAQMQLESLRRKRQQLNQHRDNKMACRMSTVVGRQQDDVVALLNIPCPLADDLFTIHQQSIQPAAVLVQRLPQAASRAPQPANLSLSRPSTPQAGSSSPPRYTSDGLLLAPESPVFAQGTVRSKVQ